MTDTADLRRNNQTVAKKKINISRVIKVLNDFRMDIEQQSLFIVRSPVQSQPGLPVARTLYYMMAVYATVWLHTGKSALIRALVVVAAYASRTKSCGFFCQPRGSPGRSKVLCQEM